MLNRYDMNILRHCHYISVAQFFCATLWYCCLCPCISKRDRDRQAARLLSDSFNTAGRQAASSRDRRRRLSCVTNSHASKHANSIHRGRSPEASHTTFSSGKHDPAGTDWDSSDVTRTSVLFLSRPRSEGWPHHGRTFV